MHGAGNDFVIIDARQMERDWAKLARAICQRHFGVGADGLLLVLPSRVADFRMRMFNPDGSEAEACGNGLRCLARYVWEKGLSEHQELTIETAAGVRKASLVCPERIWVNLGLPRLEPEQIPVLIEKGKREHLLLVAGREIRLNFVSLGNPHAVTFVEEPVEAFPLEVIGPEVEHHPLFPHRVNFEVANILNHRRIKARVWERGAGETLACGSGACAIAAAAQLQGRVEKEVDIILPGGVLLVRRDERGEIWLSGPTEMVFNGHWIERE
jgi:diaminopimelate epimerase